MENPTSVAVMRVIMGEAMRHPSVARIVSEIGPNRALGFLADYLREQMDAGVLRRANPGVAARCFMGPLVLFVLSREVLEQPDARALDAETVLTTTLDIFLRGMQPENGTRNG
jgi:hypothetical protein